MHVSIRALPIIAVLAMLPLADQPMAEEADTVIFDIDGKGDHTSRPIDIDGPFELQWSSNTGVFMLDLDRGEVFGPESPMAGRPRLERVGALSGGGSGTAYVRQGGEVLIRVNASGRTVWRVKAVQVP